MQPGVDQGALALVIKKGNNRLSTLPVDRAGRRVRSRKLISALDEKGGLKRQVQTVRTCIFAAHFREGYRFTSQEEQEQDLHQILTKSYPNVKLASFEIKDLDSVSDTASETES